MSSVEICNQALSLLGGRAIVSLEEDSTESILCKSSYDNARRSALEDREWTFALKRAELAKLLEPPVWGYSARFQIPVDCLLVVEARNDKQVDFINSLEWAREGDDILCDSSTLQLLYIADVVDTSKFTSSFRQALSARIAHDIAGSLTQSANVITQMWGLYQAKLEEAAATDGRQGRNKRVRVNELNSARIGSAGQNYFGPFV